MCVLKTSTNFSSSRVPSCGSRSICSLWGTSVLFDWVKSAAINVYEVKFGFKDVQIRCDIKSTDNLLSYIFGAKLYVHINQQPLNFNGCVNSSLYKCYRALSSTINIVNSCAVYTHTCILISTCLKSFFRITLYRVVNDGAQVSLHWRCPTLCSLECDRWLYIEIANCVSSQKNHLIRTRSRD